MNSSFSSPVIDSLCGVRQLIVQMREEVAGLRLEDGQPLWRHSIPSYRGMNILTPVIWKDGLFMSSYGGQSQFLTFDPGNSPTEAGSWKVTERWSNKTEAYMSTPVVVDGHLYLHLRNQRFICIDLTNGGELWRTQPFGKYWSLITNEKEILALDERGILRLIAAKPAAFELLDERTLTDEPCWGHLAIAGTELYVRSLRRLFAYGWG
jgi:hypothetical protein